MQESLGLFQQFVTASRQFALQRLSAYWFRNF
jgi:hypothetical protein